MNISTAMILAAGRGERLRPLTDHTPKPLIKVAGKCLIEYHIENLVAAGITTIVINTSWLGEQIQQKLGDGSAYGARLQYSAEPQALETAGGIIQALPLLGERFIVLNGDIWSDFNFSSLTKKTLNAQAHLVLINNPEHNSTGDFALETGVLKNSGKPMYTYSGIGLYSAEFFQGFKPGRIALAPILRQKSDLALISAELYSGKWLDIGTLERLQQLEYILN